jgi:nucleotide-binding universal stress UspA family protein
MKHIRRILHPSDFSRASGAAFARAVEMARANRAELLVLHVLSPVVAMVGDGYVAPQLYEQIESSARVEAPEAARPAPGQGEEGWGSGQGRAGERLTVRADRATGAVEKG